MPIPRPMPDYPRGFGPIAPHARTMPAKPAKDGLRIARACVGDAAQSQFLADVEAVGNDPAFFARMGEIARGRD